MAPEVQIKKVMKGIMYVLFGTAFAILMGFVFMWLWNWLMPDLFGLPLLTFWKSVGLILMAKILFGFGKGHGKHKHCKHCGGKGEHKKSYWREHYKKKMAGMSPDERAKYQEKMKKCWGYDPECDDVSSEALAEEDETSNNNKLEN